MTESSKEETPKTSMVAGSGIVLGLVIGAGVGIALHNLAVGIAIGFVLGVAVNAARAKAAKHKRS